MADGIIAPSVLYKKERQAWRDMMRRCYDKDHWNYPNYGSRGIRVCDRWHDIDTFVGDVAPAPTGGLYLFDRWPDNDGNYEPGNWRWATPAESQRHRRNTVKAKWGSEGKEMPVVDIAVLLGKDPLPFVRRIWQRINRQGYTVEEAIADEADGRSGERRRSNSTLVRINGGPTISLQEASEQRGLQYKTMNVRCYRGASIASALELPDTAVEVIQEVRRPRKKK